MDVYVFKLITGVELVTEYLRDTDVGYVIKRPLQAHFFRGPDGSEQVAFSHWVLTADPEEDVIEIYDNVIAAKPLPAAPDIAQSYIQNTSGIVVPPAPSGRILTG
jgi:hypothetical protein